MSKGNAEQPTAQVPRGQSSPTRVEVSAEGRQGGPQDPDTPRPQSPVTPGLQDQSGNGPQDRTGTGAANNAPAATNAATNNAAAKVQDNEPVSPNGQSKEPRPQPTATATRRTMTVTGRRSANSIGFMRGPLRVEEGSRGMITCRADMRLRRGG